MALARWVSILFNVYVVLVMMNVTARCHFQKAHFGPVASDRHGKVMQGLNRSAAPATLGRSATPLASAPGTRKIRRRFRPINSALITHYVLFFWGKAKALWAWRPFKQRNNLGQFRFVTKGTCALVNVATYSLLLPRGPAQTGDAQRLSSITRSPFVPCRRVFIVY